MTEQDIEDWNDILGEEVIKPEPEIEKLRRTTCCGKCKVCKKHPETLTELTEHIATD